MSLVVRSRDGENRALVGLLFGGVFAKMATNERQN
jgi:hypothetical protein